MKNKQGNMYKFVETWNPLAGECSHKCIYCSSKSFMRYPFFKIKYSGKPRLDKAIDTNLSNKKYNGKTIFVVAQSDLFASDVQFEDIDDILYRCRMYPDNIYFFQTKNPERLVTFQEMGNKFPVNSIFCTTIETNRDYKLSEAPTVFERAEWFSKVKGIKHLTIEPICDFDTPELLQMIIDCKPDQVNIGADSKGHNLPEPSKDKILELIDCIAISDIKVHQKENLKRLLK